MTQEEIIAELQSLVRRSQNAALLNQTVYNTFYPLFTEAHDQSHNGGPFERVTELYGNVYPFRDQAIAMEKEAKLFQEVIDLIENMDNQIIEMNER